MQDNTTFSAQEPDSREVNLIEIGRALLRKIWIIILCMAVGACGSFLYASFCITPMYSSTAGMYVIDAAKENTTVTYTDAAFSLQLINDYKEIIVGTPVLKEVKKRLKLQTSEDVLKNRITITNAQDTRVLYLTVEAESPEEAKEIASAVREVSKDYIKSVIGADQVNYFGDPELGKQTSPNIMRNTIIGALAGLFLSALVILVIFLTDNTIKSAEDVERYLGWSTLATVPSFDDEKGDEYAYRKQNLKQYIKKRKK